MFAGQLSLILFSTLWVGMLVGVSFIATPLKFGVESLTLPVALDVGRRTFSVFTRIEWVMCAILLAHMLWLKEIRYAAPGVFLLALVLSVQTLFVMPVLNGRVEAYIAAAPPPPSSDHFTYALLEGAKLLILIALCIVTIVNLTRQNPA